MLDTVLRGGVVLDGTGAPGFRADVGVSDGRIAAVDRDGRDHDSARREIDVSGLVVTPRVHRHARPLRSAVLADAGAPGRR